MATVESSTLPRNGTSVRAEAENEFRYEQWHHWQVNWTAVWIGSLASIAAALIFGLIGIAVGAHLLGPTNRVVDLHKFGIGALIFSVSGAFFAFVIGGWVTGKVAGILHAEPAMLHGAVSWLLAIPLLTALMVTGAGTFFGGWFGGLGGTPAWAAPTSPPFERPEPISSNATSEEIARYRSSLDEYHRQVKQWNEDTPKAARNSALGAVTALLIGLVGSVIGGWMACGEPMNLTHYKTRKTVWSPVHSS